MAVARLAATSVLVLLTGRQGCGKTTWVAWLVGHLTRGTPLSGEGAGPPCRVGILSLEESDGRVVARLKAAGANLERVVILGLVGDVDKAGLGYERPWRLPDDCEALATRISHDGLDLVVVDGLGYAVGGDSHNYANVGSAVSALGKVAESTGCAILGLTHPPKAGADPVTAAIGSTAWTAVARVAIVLGYDPADHTSRVVRVAKTNYAEPVGGFSF